MQRFVNQDLKSPSMSMQLPRGQRANQVNLRDRLLVIKRVILTEQKEHQDNFQNDKHHLKSNSEAIFNIKEQIHKLRTQSPQLRYEGKAEDIKFGWVYRGSREKKSYDIAKMVLSKLKLQKSKDYNRKLKKSSLFLPKLDMEGKKYVPEKQEHSLKRVQKPTQLKVESNQAILKIRKQLRYRDSKLPTLPLEPIKNNIPNQSISGWGRQVMIDNESQFFQEG